MNERRSGSILLGLVVSLAGTLLVFAGATFVLMMMAVALNGFSERQAAPWFISAIVALAIANFVVLYLANTRFVQLRAGPSGTIAAAFTILPFALVLAWALANRMAR